MRCEDIKRRIDDGSDIDAAMREHIESCPDCRRAIRAAGRMREVFASAGQETFEVPLADMRRRVEDGRSKRRSGFGRRPRLVSAFAAVAALVLFAVLVPLPYTQIDGYEVVYAGSTGEVDVHLVSAAFAAIGCGDLSVRTDEARDEVVIAGLNNRVDADHMALLVAEMTGSDTEPAVEPVRKKVTKPLINRIADIMEDSNDSVGVIIMRAENGAWSINGSALKDAIVTGDLNDSVLVIRLDSLLSRAGAESRGINMILETDTSGLYHILKLKRAVDGDADNDLKGSWSVVSPDSQEIRLYFRRSDGEEGIIEIDTGEFVKEHEVTIKTRKENP